MRDTQGKMSNLRWLQTLTYIAFSTKKNQYISGKQGRTKDNSFRLPREKIKAS